MEGFDGILYKLQFSNLLWGEVVNHIIDQLRRREVDIVPAEKGRYRRAGQYEDCEKGQNQADDLVPIPFVKQE